jgi:hypothetical protein
LGEMGEVFLVSAQVIRAQTVNRPSIAKSGSHNHGKLRFFGTTQLPLYAGAGWGVVRRIVVLRTTARIYGCHFSRC